MESPEIAISIALAFINATALFVGAQFDKFKLTVVILAIFDVLTILTLLKLN